MATVHPGPPGSPTSETFAALRGGSRLGDTIFRRLTQTSGIFVLVVLAAIAGFLVDHAIPLIHLDKANFWTTKQWTPNGDLYGIVAIAFGTVETALIAVIIAWPVALGVSLFVVEYAPRRLARPMGYVLDVLAAIPSIVYGLWGFAWLVPKMGPVQGFLNDVLGWIPIFHTPYGSSPVKSIFIASLVLAIMILPIMAAVMREVFLQADPAHREAAMALGATRWEILRYAVLPPSRSGIIGATILGLGRALGETIAIALVLGTSYTINWHILTYGGNTIAANIALTYGEADQAGIAALIASGLVLFAITLLVNLAARFVIYRTRTDA